MNWEVGTLPETPMYGGDEVDFRVRLPVGHLNGDGLVGALWRPGERGPDKREPDKRDYIYSD